jgi:hypothetical protein
MPGSNIRDIKNREKVNFLVNLGCENEAADTDALRHEKKNKRAGHRFYRG